MLVLSSKLSQAEHRHTCHTASISCEERAELFIGRSLQGSQLAGKEHDGQSLWTSRKRRRIWRSRSEMNLLRLKTMESVDVFISQVYGGHAIIQMRPMSLLSFQQGELLTHVATGGDLGSSTFCASTSSISRHRLFSRSISALSACAESTAKGRHLDIFRRFSNGNRPNVLQISALASSFAAWALRRAWRSTLLLARRPIFRSVQPRSSKIHRKVVENPRNHRRSEQFNRFLIQNPARNDPSGRPAAVRTTHCDPELGQTRAAPSEGAAGLASRSRQV